MELTKQDNTFLEKFKGKIKTTKADIEKEVRKSKYYTDATDKQIENAVDRIYEKLQTINSEYMKWFEFLIAFVLVVIFPNENEAIRDGRRSYAIPNYYFNVNAY